MATPPKPDLEAIFAQLEATINMLEDEKAPLSDSLDAFEKGIKLTRQAQKTLLEAEQKVNLLLEQDGEPREKNFVEGNGE